ncbi:response regulator [Mesonia oceanica]|uniref:Response regulator UvrY n=1 Tax=Mesonia oceanica TaxID=2687242 RepID=A0AC61Y942_9FLAO|nr:response regulator [Mesonia oceanica]MBJ96840.1 response regulator [Flavobacteriaceae bacterium]VVV00918.1 Response regulator UvrY [Mesonia oceanica]|tara:strand:- start:21350 stop:22015 length:666 start_codon:yes stop_codon:yes gene_type:complete
MKKEEINILLVDDHHMILEGYKNVLSKIKSEDYDISVETADNCDTAWEILKGKKFDIVFLDINFPIEGNNKILSGEDLGIKIKKELPEVKIIILTVLADPFRLHNLLLNINPAGFLMKGETTSEELKRCLSKVIIAPPYYGSKISKLLHSEISLNTSLIDEVDRIMLYQLSLGTKTKDLTKYVHLSLRAVEDRKRKLKEIFGVSGQGNKALLEKARESGYI